MGRHLAFLFFAILVFGILPFSYASRGNLRLIGHQSSKPQLPFHTMPLYGNTTMGYYYTFLYFGRPRQKQSVIIDTGSNILTSPCKKCDKCGNHMEQYYDSKQSYSSQVITCINASKYPNICEKSCVGNFNNQNMDCGFQISYSQGSKLNGFYLQDYVYLQNDTKGEGVLMNFGCTLSESKLFFQQSANGILGLAPSKGYAFQNLFKQHSPLTNQQLIISICLARNGGVMAIGGSNNSIHTESPIRTAINFTQQDNFYMIENFQQVKINGKIIHDQLSKIALRSPFFDSGNTITFFPFDEYIRTKDNLKQLCFNHPQCKTTQGSLKLAFHLLSDELTDQPQTSIENLQRIVQKIFPPMLFTINGKDIQWKSRQYFAIYSLEERNIILGIDGLTYFTLGQNWLVNKDIVLDIKQKSANIFPNSKCSQQEGYKNQMLYYYKQKPKIKLKYAKSIVENQMNQNDIK